MRILITTLTEKELNGLSNERSTRNVFSRNKTQQAAHNSTERRPFLSSDHSLAKLTPFSFNNPNITFIKVKHPNLRTLKRVSSIYERPPSRNSKKPSIIADSLTLPTLYSNKSQSHCSMKDILSSATVYKMLKSIQKESRDKEKATVIDEGHFRTVYGSKSTLMKAQEMLNDPSISKERKELIHYLGKKETMNISVIKKINQSNDQEKVKIDKACRMLLANSDNEKVFKAGIEMNIRKKNTEMKLALKRNVDQMKSEVTNFEAIMRNYIGPMKNVDAYKEKHYAFSQNYWEKYDFNRLMQKTKGHSKKTTKKGLLMNKVI